MNGQMMDNEPGFPHERTPVEPQGTLGFSQTLCKEGEKNERQQGRVKKVLKREVCCLSERVDVVSTWSQMALSNSLTLSFAGTHACSHLETCPDTALF